MSNGPWIVTFKLRDAAGTVHCYVVKERVNWARARALAWARATSEEERFARRNVEIDASYSDIVELSNILRNE
ncbi:hypothetical protein [Streptomyces chartreusis]|uniref:hypothetical protein n=1 Tax=Streptomyces chartreusis TaxID=1969 RepID=UPI0036BDB23C